jgi:hypothetical protein
MKNNWQKPELIVLLRGRTEEVLTNGCKTAQGIPKVGYPTVNSNGCGKTLDTNCGSCQGRSGSTS